MAGSGAYTSEQQQAAVEAYRELLGNGNSRWRARVLAGQRFGVSPSILRTWIDHSLVWSTHGGGGGDNETVSWLRHELKFAQAKLERTRVSQQIAADAVRFFGLAGQLPPPALIHAFGHQNLSDFTPDVVSSVLSNLFWPENQPELVLALSGPSDQDYLDAQGANMVWDLWVDNYRCYDQTKMFHLMQRQGISISQRKVQELMDLVGAEGLEVVPRPTSMAVLSRPEKWGRNPNAWPVPNNLNQWWNVDVTRVSAGKTDYAVALLVDIASRRVLAWSLSRAGAVVDVDQLVATAVTQRNDDNGTPVEFSSVSPNDRPALTLATELSAEELQALAGLELRDPELFVLPTCAALFQTSLAGRPETAWATKTDLENDLHSWVNWYNTTRLHSDLGYATPVEIEDNLVG